MFATTFQTTSLQDRDRIPLKRNRRRRGLYQNRKRRYFLLRGDAQGSLLLGNRVVTILSFVKKRERDLWSAELTASGEWFSFASGHDRLRHRDTGRFVSVYRAH
ncbi:MAG: hypothetical protein ABL994_19280 [Verrucomicrobiales bacterium]